MMEKSTLTLVDVRGIQRYLFDVNELKQNLGASVLVELATHAWIIEALPEPTNVRWNQELFKVEFENTKGIEGGELKSEALFFGGGNAAILFPDRPQALAFARRYSRWVLSEAPGLDVAIGHIEVDLEKPQALRSAWRLLKEDVMPKRKEGRTVSQALLGLGVTAECAFTGLPAVEDDRDGNRRILVSAQVKSKRDDSVVKMAKDRLNTLMQPKEPFEYPSDFDDLGGERGHARYIAVVHADGNNMGKRIEDYVQAGDNRAVIEKIREFSEAVNQVGQDAMEAVCDLLRKTPVIDSKNSWIIADSWREEEVIRFTDDFLPFRPIVFGGDDITFVCDGRLGLTLAVEFLKAFSETKLPDEERGYACAGVAIVHSHYPFARAYGLAEELMRQAKQEARRLDDQARVSLLNWHYATSGLTLDWDEIKRREYLGGKLLLRPLIINKASGVRIDTWRTWDVFLAQTEGFRVGWDWGRNTLKDLGEALRKGPTDTIEFVSRHDKLPDTRITGLEEVHQKGWFADHCIYFDALEADDLFIYPKEVNNE
jgi:hypothetical protein